MGRATVGWAKRSVPTALVTPAVDDGGHASLCPPYSALPDADRAVSRIGKWTIAAKTPSATEIHQTMS